MRIWNLGWKLARESSWGISSPPFAGDRMNRPNATLLGLRILRCCWGGLASAVLCLLTAGLGESEVVPFLRFPSAVLWARTAVGFSAAGFETGWGTRWTAWKADRLQFLLILLFLYEFGPGRFLDLQLIIIRTCFSMQACMGCTHKTRHRCPDLGQGTQKLT
jgi:hypothetical protein